LLSYAGVMLRRFSAEASRVFCQRCYPCMRDPSGLKPAQGDAGLRWMANFGSCVIGTSRQLLT